MAFHPIFKNAHKKISMRHLTFNCAPMCTYAHVIEHSGFIEKLLSCNFSTIWINTFAVVQCVQQKLKCSSVRGAHAAKILAERFSARTRCCHAKNNRNILFSESRNLLKYKMADFNFHFISARSNWMIFEWWFTFKIELRFLC